MASDKLLITGDKLLVAGGELLVAGDELSIASEKRTGLPGNPGVRCVFALRPWVRPKKNVRC